MRARCWAALAALYLVVILFLILGPVGLNQAQANEAEEQQLLDLINKYRQENGVTPLVPSGTLSTSAEHHSKDMSDHDFFSHRTKESSHYPADSGPADRMAREGYPTDAATAENIASGQPTADEVFDDWRRSPEHDAAMLDGQYTAAGVGQDGTYWTTDFGSVSDSPLTVETQKPDAENKAPDTERAPARRMAAEPVAEEQNSTPQPADEQANDEQEGDRQKSDGQAQLAETPLTTESGNEIHTIVDMEHDDPQRTAGFEAETPDAEQPPTESASEPESEPATDEQTSIKEMANEETRTGEISPNTEPSGEAPSGTPAEQPLTEQTALPQPGMQPPAGERPTGEQEQQAKTSPILGPGEEAVPLLVPAQPATEGPTPERDTTGDTSLAEALRTPDTESTITQPAAGTAAQSTPTAITEQDIRKASPVETEAMEAALAPRDAVPENLVRREPSAPTEESPVGIPAVLQAAPAALASSTLGNTPAAVKALPRTSGAPTLPLFVGSFLLLSGVLIYGASRRQRGR